tara:strand:- start:1418 stop:1579 length:162 start_codon:yes stop_codon:yes gene_type:complete
MILIGGIWTNGNNVDGYSSTEQESEVACWIKANFANKLTTDEPIKFYCEKELD